MKRARQTIELLWSVLREVFDESAYQRFLQRTAQGASCSSYQAFERELAAARATRPRCC
jgi:hypothetical protein